MASIYTANNSSVLIDGEPIDNLQSLAFRVLTERENVRAVGTDERIAVSFGLRTVEGEIVAKSASTKLDELLRDRAQFQLLASLKKDESSEPRSYSFDECYVETKSFGLDANGSALTTYGFSATRIREE